MAALAELAADTSRTRPNHLAAHVLALGLLFLAEAAIFYWVALHQITPFYPFGFDQMQYYLEVLDIFERGRAVGWWALLEEFASPVHASGVLYPVLGAAMAMIFGFSRPAILSVNLIFFFALQIA